MTEGQTSLENLSLVEVASLVLATIIYVSKDDEEAKNLIIGMAESIKVGLVEDENK